MVVALHHVVDLDGAAVIARDGEANGVGPFMGWEALAEAPGIAQVAERRERSFVGLPRLARSGAAEAHPIVSQRQHRAWRADGNGARPYRVEIRASHFGGIVARDMASTRLDILKGMVAQSPTDSFLRYGLAMELRNANNLEAALAEFHALLAVNPDYSAAYFHGGQTLERLARLDEARAMYREGIAAATRKGDLHTRGEMQTALDILGD